MPVPIAELFISVSVDTSQAVSALGQMDSRARSTAEAFRQATPAALVFAGAGTAIGAGFLGAIKVAATFEQQMSAVRSVMSPREAKAFGGALDDLAISLGAATQFTATEVGASFEALLKLGISAEQILGGAGNAVLSLAASTGSDLTDAATVATQALNAFGLPVEKLPGLVDTLAGVINVTAADLNDIKLGFSDTAATARSLGLTVEDTAISLGILRQNALTGNRAGTAFRAMLLGLTPGTKQQTKLFDQLGLTVNGTNNAFFDSTGTIRNVTSIAGTLQHALQGMSAEQRNATLEILFGRDGMEAANILIKEGSEGWDNYTQQVKQISASDQAAERLNNLLGRLEQLGGALQSAQIIIGKFFAPAIGVLADVVKEAIQAFTQMTPAAKATATAIVGIAGVVLGATGGLTLLAITARFLAPSFVAVGKVLLSLVPLFRVVTAVAAALAFAWATNLGGIQEKVQAAFAAIPAILDRVGNAFAAAGEFWQTTISPALQRLSDFISTKFNDIFRTIADSPVGQTIGHIFDVLGTVFSAIISGNGQLVLDFFKSNLPQAFKDFGASIEGPLGIVFDVIDKVFQAIITGNGQLVIDFFKSGLPQPIKDLGAALEGPVGNFFSLLDHIFGAIVSGNGQLVIDFFKANLPDALKTLGAALEGPANALGGFAEGAGAGFTKFFTETLPPVLAAIGNISGDVGAGLKTFFTETIPPVLAGIGGFAGDVGAGLLAWFQEKLPIIRDAALQFGTEVGAGLQKFFTETLPPITEAIGNFGGEVGGNLLRFFGEHMPVVTTALLAFANDPGGSFLLFFRDQLPAAIASMEKFTADTATALVDFFVTKTPGIIAGMQQFTPAAVDPFLAFFTNLDTVKTQVESLGPLFTAVGNFGTALANLSAAIAGLAGRAFGTIFGDMGTAIQTFATTVGPAAGPIATIATTLETLGTKLSGVTAFFEAAAVALNNLAASLNAIPIEKWLALNPNGTPAIGPPAPSTGPGGLGNLGNNKWPWEPAAFNPNGSGGGPLINIGQLIISTEAEAEAFLARMAEVIRGSAGRVNVPPDNSGNPALVTSQ